MQGTIRTYNDPTLNIVKAKIKLLAENTAIAMNCVAHVDLVDLYPVVVNHKTETEHVIKLAKANFGADKVKTEGLPLTASEDFSYFLENRPGCFYMLGIKKTGENYSLHTSYFDYNDSMIASGGLLFVRIAEDRLGAQIL
jgi:hippurate hydrolase